MTPALTVRRRRVRLVAAVAMGLAGFGACSARQPPPTGLVVITLDTTRADRLSPYGYMNVALPAIERLAREGVVFDRASSVAPLTLPAHTSLFTGLIPPRHGVRDNADPPLDGAITTLADALAARGFTTAAFVGSAVLAPDRGLAQGFATYTGPAGRDGTPDEPQRPADAVIDDALRWIEGIGGSPFLLWTHLYDPHRPYDPPAPYQSLFAHDPYLGEIVFADAQIGRLLDGLERAGRLDDTLIVLTADHGESLGAHGEQDHGIFVYEEVIWVPLIVRVPGLTGGRVGSLVRLVDVMPTVLDWLGVDAVAGDGVSLRPVMVGEASSMDLEAYAESLYPERFGWSGLRSISDGRYKLIDAPRPELYDLDRDPFEQTNLFGEREALAKAMTARLRVVGGETGAGTSAASAPDTPADVRERLAALGYVGTRVHRAAPGEPRGPDPKDCIALLATAGARAAAGQSTCR